MRSSVLQPSLMRSRWAAIGAAVAVSLGAGGLAIANAATSAAPTLFHSLSPVRVFDTRTGTGGVPVAKVTAGGTLDVVVRGVNGVPADATAVALNVTVVDGTAASFLTVWPTGDPRPLASSLNWTNGDATPNSVTVPIGTAGKVSFFNNAGTVNVLADVAGYYTPADTPPFTPVAAQVLGAAALGTGGDIASVALTLPDTCPGVPDQWKVLVHADGYFLTGANPTGGATIALSTTSGAFDTGTIANQNLNGAGQLREIYATTFLFTVDAGTQTFYEYGSTSVAAGVSAAQNNLIAQSVSVSC